jgi:16S rRNA (cytosine967-C5)-methyltransferase
MASRSTRAEPAGFPARAVALDILDNVLRRRRPLEEQFDGPAAHPRLASLADRDRALARAVIAMVLRRLGRLRALLGAFLPRGYPANAPRLEGILLLGAAQILWLDVPDHAAVDLSVELARKDAKAVHYSGLVNAVLRRVAREGAEHIAKLESDVDTPPWLMQRWARTYGFETARAIAGAHAHEPALDFTVKGNPEPWVTAFGGRLLETGSVRAIVHGPIRQLPGYGEGAWWVQDAAAALPARLCGDVRQRRVADLCAAPGGKAAQLALAEARLVAVDRSEPRLERLRDNLKRLGLHAETVIADATVWEAEPFDAILLDAPCSSTGTIRRHPDIPWIKREADIAKLAALQHRLIRHAVDLLRPGGILVYCTCSLEPEEGRDIVEDLIRSDPRVRRCGISPVEIGGRAEFITATGDLRTLPCHWPDPDPRWAGLDGFYAARLQRT